MMTSLFVLGLIWVDMPTAPETVAQWSFNGTDTALVEAASTPTGARLHGRPPAYSDDVPGAYVYDPLTQQSRANVASAVFRGDADNPDALAINLDFARAGLADTSVTIECFVKPDKAARGDAWLAGKTRGSDAGSELSVEWHEMRQHHQTWHGAAYALPNQQPQRWTSGHYSSSTRLTEEVAAWRHVAVVYDRNAGTVTCWVDYHLAQSEQVREPLRWDDGPFLIGGRAERWSVVGKVDEVRVVRGALSPAQFLRARADAISGVSFASNQQIVPRDAGCLDVKEHFGAAGDGRTDDTAAFNAAFEHLANKVPLAYNTLLIPPGTYLVSGMLYCSRFIDVKGAGPEQTVIRLQDNTFTDPNQPQPVLRMSSTQSDPGSHHATNGSSISLYLEGLTIDTGRGNPGAKALEYHSNNLGRLEHVVLRSDDGAGVLGLDLTHHDVGPALVKHVTIHGFETGIAIRYQEYSMTLEHVTLSGQRVVGIRNQGNILAIRGLRSVNRVPVVVAEGANSMVTLVDSTLTGGSAEQAAVQAAGGLYCLRLRTGGYGTAVAHRVLMKGEHLDGKDVRIPGPDVTEYFGGPNHVVRGFGEGDGTLQLPIEETPTPPLPPVNEWVNVVHFVDRKIDDNWSPVVQAAIDSGARVIYFPRTTRFSFETPIHLRGRVQQLVGFGAELHWAPEVWKSEGRYEQTDAENAPPPLLIFDQTDPTHTLVLDRLGCVHLRHDSPATLVLRSSTPGRYTTGSAGGRLFAEDVGGADWHFDHPQRVWVRQWNPESHAAGPCIHSLGTTIWALGFKTEYESQKLLADADAATEILGAFIYPIGEIPADRPIFENRNSRIALVYGTSVYHSNHQTQIRDIRGSEVKEIGNEALRKVGSRARMDLYTSDAR